MTDTPTRSLPEPETTVTVECWQRHDMPDELAAYCRVCGERTNKLAGKVTATLTGRDALVYSVGLARIASRESWEKMLATEEDSREYGVAVMAWATSVRAQHERISALSAFDAAQDPKERTP